MVKVFNAPYDHVETLAIAAKILTQVEDHLKDRPYLVADRLTAADVALYSYIARAPDGEVDLAPYPAIRGWLDRIEAHPRFVPFG